MENIQYSNDDQIDLSKLFKIILKGKWIIGAVTASSAIFAVLYSLSLPDIYQSNALLVPVETANISSGPLKSYSGLAGLAGINLSPKGSESNTIQALQKIKSLSFFQDDILPNIVLQDLMAVKKWDKQSNKIFYNKNIFNQNSNTWVQNKDFFNHSKPSAQESYKKFISDHLMVNEDSKTGFITLSIKHQSPYIAKRWVELLISQINIFYREKDRVEAEKAVEYLNSQILKTNYTEIKQVVASLVQEKTQKLTLIEANEFYVFDYIDPPQVMEKKSEPFRALICILVTLFGGMVGTILVFIREYFYNGIESKK